MDSLAYQVAEVSTGLKNLCGWLQRNVAAVAGATAAMATEHPIG
jgi:hypothetical protein